MSTPMHDLETLRDWLRYAVSRFGEAGLAFGHGTTNAYDEAAYLLLHSLHLPLDRLEPFLDARLTQAERTKVAQLLERRIDQRVPAAYLTHEAWLGDFRFYVDERVLIPRSFIAELLPEGLAPFVGAARVGVAPRSTSAPARAASRSCWRTPSRRGRRRRRHLDRRAHRRPAQRRRLRPRRPDQPHPVRHVLESYGQELRPHHQQPAVRHVGGDGRPPARVPARAPSGTRRRRGRPRRRAHDPDRGATIPEPRRYPRRGGRAQPRLPPSSRSRGCRSSGWRRRRRRTASSS